MCLHQKCTAFFLIFLNLTSFMGKIFVYKGSISLYCQEAFPQRKTSSQGLTIFGSPLAGHRLVLETG